MNSNLYSNKIVKYSYSSCSSQLCKVLSRREAFTGWGGGGLFELQQGGHHRATWALVLKNHGVVLLTLWRLDDFCLWNKLIIRSTQTTKKGEGENGYTLLLCAWGSHKWASNKPVTFWKLIYILSSWGGREGERRQFRGEDEWAQEQGVAWD
jgi:hypothetical protein